MEDVKTKRRVSLPFFQRWKKSLRFQLLGNSAKLDKSLDKAGIIRKQFDFKAYIHTCIHTYMYTHIHTYIHAYIHTYIHTCIQTDRQTADIHEPKYLNTSFRVDSKRNIAVYRT